MLEAGILIRQDTSYISNFVLVPPRTPEGTTRFAVDLRRLNEITIPDPYPTKSSNELFNYLSTATHYTSLDITKSYWTLKIPKEDIKYYGVYSPLGVLCFTRLPFGDINAMAYWQRIYDKIIREVLPHNAISYVDDLVIYTSAEKSEDQHLFLVEKMLQQFERYNLKFISNKSQICKSTIKFLGWKVSSQGKIPDPSNVNSILNRKIPDSIKNVKSFLGATGYFRQSIEGYAQLALPLTNLTKLKSTFQWTPDCQYSYDTIIHKLFTAPVLMLPQFDRTFHIYCDSSMEAMAGLIAQYDNNKRLRPIRFYSKKWPYFKRQKSINLLELQAVCYTLLGNSDILALSDIIVYTDNKSIISIFNNSTDPQFTRYISYISSFKVVFKHIKSCQNNVADDMTRCEILEQEIQDVNILNVDPILIETESKAKQSDYLKKRNETFINAQKNDPYIQSLIREFPNIDKDKFIILNNILYKKVQRKNAELSKDVLLPILPKNMVHEYLTSIHDFLGHFGIQKTILFAKDSFYWEGMEDDITKFIKSCEACQLQKAVRDQHPAFERILVPQEPFSIVCLDIMGPLKDGQNKTYVVNTIDTTTRYWIPYLVEDQCCDTIIAGLISNVITKFGAMKYLLMDNQSSLKTPQFQQILNKMNIQCIYTTPYHKTGNSLVERSFRTMENIISTLTAAEKKHNRKVNINFAEFIPQTALYYNVFPNMTTKMSPYELLFGRKPHLACSPPTPPVAQIDINPNIATSYYLLQEGWKLASEISMKIREQANQKLQYAEKSITIYEPGDKVIIYRPNAASKISTNFTKPYTVKYQEGKIVYLTKSTRGRPKMVHVYDVKPFIERERSFKTSEKVSSDVPITKQY
uniref:RNA-directed DNA polymerase n=1 Tax=Strongyloides venezuelensis TaxID=75913 RepID=A0A0K0FNV1_STRVS